MYKKLMFLISLVVLLGLFAGARAEELEIAWGVTHTVYEGTTEEYEDMKCEGTVFIEKGATLILNDRSKINGNGTDGEGGSEFAKVIVEGTFIMNGRLDVSDDEDAYLIVQNGGSVIHTDEKICLPDSDDGVARLIVINGTVVAEGIEVDDDGDRKAGVQIACSPIPGVIIAKITTANTDEDDKWDPDYWVTRDINEGGLYDYPKGACSSSILIINDLGGNVKEVFYFAVPDGAWGPTPEDGAVEQVVDVDLEWKPGAGVPNPVIRHVIYFGTSWDDVNDAGTTDLPFQGYKTPGNELWDLDVDSSPPIILELWKTYYWRVDEFATPDKFKGDVWSFTTGCSLVPGDINLDCLVNFEDYAMLADDWRDKSFFPTNVVP